MTMPPYPESGESDRNSTKAEGKLRTQDWARPVEESQHAQWGNVNGTPGEKVPLCAEREQKHDTAAAIGHGVEQRVRDRAGGPDNGQPPYRSRGAQADRESGKRGAEQDQKKRGVQDSAVREQAMAWDGHDAHGVGIQVRSHGDQTRGDRNRPGRQDAA